MLHNTSNLRVHFIGIGGIGMSGIAEILLKLGFTVSGSDVNRSANVIKLEEMGAKIFEGHQASNLGESSIVVYTSAITDNNPELLKAKENNIPIMKRAEMLAELMRLKKGVAIGGTHGKTTTTSLLATILEESNYDPTYIIGGIVENLKGHAKVGTGEFLVAEADESDGTFLLLNPIISLITNIDDDHIDFYGSSEAYENAFLDFANRVPFYGSCVINIHDEKIKKIQGSLKKPSVTFGIFEEGLAPDYMAKNLEHANAYTAFDFYIKDKFVGKTRLNLPGRHNVLNCLGAMAIAHIMNVDIEKILNSVQKFHGVGRRFQTVFNNEKGFEVIDDYAHHPTEVRMTLKTFRETRKDKKLAAIFEPHRYSRTKECWKEFLHSFNDVDKLYLLPVYAASEDEVEGINSENLAKDINRLHPDLCECIEVEDLQKLCEDFADKKMSVMTMGAGAIGKKIRECKFE